MVGAKPFSSPCSSGLKLSAHDREPLTAAQVTEYRQTVGALQYCTLTRPDISFSVNQLCQFIQCLHSSHWSATKMVLRLRVLLIMVCGIPKAISLQAYCGSDWVGNLDDRQSTTCYGVFLNLYLVFWTAKN